MRTDSKELIPKKLDFNTCNPETNDDMHHGGDDNYEAQLAIFDSHTNCSDEDFNKHIKNDKYELCLYIMSITKWSYVFVSSMVDECIVKAMK